MAATLAVIASVQLPAEAVAREATESGRASIDIAPQPLPRALAELSRQAGISIGMSGALPNVRGRRVRGRMTAGSALARLLRGTGLVARKVGPTAWRIERAWARPATSHSPAPAPSVDGAIRSAPIVVSATKRDADLLSLPLAASVVRIPAETQGDAAAGSDYVAANAEGIALTGLGPGRNRMFLRGVADSAFGGESQSTVAVMLDDARVTYAAPDPDLRLVDVARVEVLKGPQGALYGTGALGGIYRIVTNRADVRDWSATGTAGAQSVASGKPGFTGSGMANLVLARDRAALRVVGYSAYEPGWVDTGARKNANATRVAGGRAELGIVPAQGWRIDAMGQVQRLETRDSAYVYAPGARSRPAQAAEPHDNDLDVFSLRVKGGIGVVEAVLVTSVARHEVQDTLDATIGADGLGLSDPALFVDTRHYRVWNTELRVNGTSGALHWLVGAAHLEARQHGVQKLAGKQPGEALTIADTFRTSAETALFVDAGAPLAGRLSLDGGARIFRDVVETTRSEAGGSQQARRRFGITPTVALSLRNDDSALAWLRFGTAFRQGGIDHDGTGQVRTFAGDELATVEAGWRRDLGGDGLLEIGAYYTWWRDVQSDMLSADGLIETRNAGRARIIGAEATLRRPLPGRWTIDLGAAYQDARLVRNDLGFELDDRRLPVIPEFTLRGALEKQFALGRAQAWLKAFVRYSGPARLSFDPLLDRAMGNLLDTRIEGGVTLGDFHLSADVDNLFDAGGNRFAYGNSFRIATMRQFIPQRPRTVTIAIGRSF
ncbi:TonB-dependent receptor [Novosphingobium sp. ZN18A2]|uniref:TonB-dependent receptor n=1 Tax=Novosphingobium sp. ZN18A2 TaxID=3079861 RepID=UPI0030CE3C4B